jgi:hypothetical protein
LTSARQHENETGEKGPHMSARRPEAHNPAPDNPAPDETSSPPSANGSTLALESAVATPSGDRMCVSLGQHSLYIQRSEHGGSFRLVSPRGEEPLEVVLTDATAVLRLGSGLSVLVEGKVEIAADAISLRARDHLALESGGTASIRAEGALTTEADAQLISARLGDVQVRANDDVMLHGERVRVNC